MKNKSRKRKPQIIIYIIIILLAILFIYPFWHTAVLSFSDKAFANEAGFKLWPRNFSIDAYKIAFSSGLLIKGYGNTIWRVGIGTLITLVITFCAAFAMTHKELPGWKVINFVIVFTMFFNGGLIPTYLNLKTLGLLNTRWALVLPSAAGAYNFIVMRSFLSGISREMEEAARIDGASVLQTLIKVILPLSKPVIAVIGLWSAVWHWNSWYDAIAYANKDNLIVLQTLVRRLIDVGNQVAESGSQMTMADMTPETVRAATVMVTTVPILLIYPFVQKYFVKGTMVGAVKG